MEMQRTLVENMDVSTLQGETLEEKEQYRQDLLQQVDTLDARYTATIQEEIARKNDESTIRRPGGGLLPDGYKWYYENQEWVAGWPADKLLEVGLLPLAEPTQEMELSEPGPSKKRKRQPIIRPALVVDDDENGVDPLDLLSPQHDDDLAIIEKATRPSKRRKADEQQYKPNKMGDTDGNTNWPKTKEKGVGKGNWTRKKPADKTKIDVDALENTHTDSIHSKDNHVSVPVPNDPVIKSKMPSIRSDSIMSQNFNIPTGWKKPTPLGPPVLIIAGQKQQQSSSRPGRNAGNLAFGAPILSIDNQNSFQLPRWLK